jgi:CIC family chloride channel protein
LPAFTFTSSLELVLYALLGVAAGVAGVLFIRVLYGSEDLADRLWRGPQWARPAIGGLLLGLVLLALPELYGVGYPVLSHAVAGRYAIGFVLLLLVGKIAATSLTIAIGGSGGVFAPSLFTGISGRLTGDTIYTLKLRRRGIAVDRPRVPSVMQTVLVSQAMGDLPDRSVRTRRSTRSSGG